MAVVVDATGTKLITTVAGTSVNYTGITVGSGNNSALVVTVACGAAVTAPTATWDTAGANQAMSLITTVNTQTNITTFMFGLRNPVAGNKTLNVAWTTSAASNVEAISFTGVEQRSDAAAFTPNNFAKDGATAASISMGLTALRDAISVASYATTATFSTLNQTNIFTDVTNVGCEGGATRANGTGASILFTGTDTTTTGNKVIVGFGVVSDSAPPNMPWQNPVWSKKGLATHLQSFIVSEPFGPPKEAIPKVYRWLAAFSEPVRFKCRLATHLQSFIVSEPFGPPKESIPKVYRWFAPLSEPARIVRTPNKVNLFPFTAASTTAATAVSIDWLAPLSEPVRRKVSVTDQQVLAFVPPPALIIGWSAPLSEPVRAKQRAIADYAYAPLAVSEVVTIDKWFNPLADPAKKAGLRTSSQQSYFASPFIDQNAIALNTRFNQLLEPTRARVRPTESPALFFVATTATAETITVDKWFVSFQDPVRKAGLGTGSQQALAFVKADPFPETVTESRWHQPWSEPVRRVGLSSANQQALAFVAPVAVVAAPDESWFAPLTDPVRRIPAAQKVNLFPFTAAAVVAVETVTVDKWFKSFTEPVRVKPGLATALQQSLAFVKAAPFPETVTEDRWHQPWSEPRRSKPGLSAANQAAFFAPSTVITAQAVDIGWFNGLSDPTRRKTEERDHYKGENEFTAIAASMEWYAPLTELVRQKIGLSVTQQQALAQPVFVTTETITVDKWFAPFREPVRVKPALLTARQQFLTWPPQIIIPSLASWWRPLSDPPKAKAGLSVANQRFQTQSTDFIPHPDRFLEGWFNWLSEPVRKLAQLNVALQRAWTGPDRNAVQATITVTMAATETNNDVALFAIKVFAGNPPATAVVSLVEIGHGASLTSIVEEGDDGSGTSIVES